MDENNINQAFLMKQILDELTKLKSNMPNGELKHLQDSIEDLRRDQKSLKDDISDIKKKLLDPETGVIVKVNENTKFRIEQEKLQEREEKEYKELILEHSELMKWKGGVTKAMWIFFTAIVGIVAKIFFMGDPS